MFENFGSVWRKFYEAFNKIYKISRKIWWKFWQIMKNFKKIWVKFRKNLRKCIKIKEILRSTEKIDFCKILANLADIFKILHKFYENVENFLFVYNSIISLATNVLQVRVLYSAHPVRRISCWRKEVCASSASVPSTTIRLHNCVNRVTHPAQRAMDRARPAASRVRILCV